MNVLSTTLIEALVIVLFKKEGDENTFGQPGLKLWLYLDLAYMNLCGHMDYSSSSSSSIIFFIKVTNENTCLRLGFKLCPLLIMYMDIYNESKYFVM